MIRSAYSERLRVTLDMPEDEVSRTKQSFKDECDIRNILKKFQKTGIIEHARRYGGEYGVAHAVDFKTAMDIVARGKSMWESLPSSLKKRFASPEAFVAFAHDDKNIEEARELGLIPPKEDDVPPKAVDKPAKPVDVPKEAKPTEGD